MSAPARHQLALTAAAELYERLVASGECRCDAFRLALDSIGRNSKGRPIVAVPPELPALIEAIVRSQVSEVWRDAVREVTSGRSRDKICTDLRALVAHVLLMRGYHPRSIGLAMGRDRSTIIQQNEVFRRRLESDQLLAARAARVLAAFGSPEARAA